MRERGTSKRGYGAGAGTTMNVLISEVVQFWLCSSGCAVLDGLLAIMVGEISPRVKFL